MKNLIPIVLLLGAFSSQGQKVETKTDTNYYKLDEKFEISFVANFTPDSTYKPTFSGFEIISGPSTNSSVSVRNGEKTISYKLLYTLKPNQPGILQIPSVKFFTNGLAYEAKTLGLNIAETPLTKAEIEERGFTLFVEKSIKPTGTTRISFHKNFGYIEEFTGFQWIFKRRLTELEIEDLEKLTN